MKKPSQELVDAFIIWYNNDPHCEYEDLYKETINASYLSGLSREQFLDFFSKFTRDGGMVQSQGHRNASRLRETMEADYDRFHTFVMEPFDEGFDEGRWLNRIHEFDYFGKGIATIYLNRINKRRFAILNNKSAAAMNFFDIKLPSAIIDRYQSVRDAERQLIDWYPAFDNFYRTDALTHFLVGEQIGQPWAAELMGIEPKKRYWLYAPGRGGEHWEELYSQGIMAIGWDYLGDLNQYTSKDDIANAMRDHDDDPDSSKKNNATSCFSFCKIMQPGDIVYCKIGRSRIVGLGIISSDYFFDSVRAYYQSLRKVDWKLKGEWTVSDENRFALKTITDITRYIDFRKYLHSLLDANVAEMDEADEDVPSGESRQCWWINANPKIWDLVTSPVGMKQTYTSHNEKGHKRRVYQYFKQVKTGDLLFGYAASPLRRLVALCSVTKGLHQTSEGEVFEFEIIEHLPESVSFKELQAVPALAKCEPLINNQGSLFKVSPLEHEIIRSIIEEKGEREAFLEEEDEEVMAAAINIVEFMEQVEFERKVDLVPHSLGDPQRIRINGIINHISKTDWVLPHFQRYFDWNKTNVKDFWESIFNDYYVGSFLLWETDKNPELGIQPILGVLKNPGEIRPLAIILDGQQRITSLYYAIKAPQFPLKGSKNPLFFYINFYSYFNESAENGVVEIHANKISREESFNRILFPLFELEKYNVWVDAFEDFLLAKTKDSDKVRRIRRIIDKILRHIWEGFEIPYIALPASMELRQVTDIFENINTKGKLLSVFDLLIARLYKDNIELRKMWDATLKKFPDILRYSKHIPKMSIYILQAMSLLYEKSSTAKRVDILDIYQKVYLNPDRDFEQDWHDTAQYMSKAIEKLENMRDGFGVKDEREIPFAPMIPVLSALLKVIDLKTNKADCYKRLNKWYWSAVFTNAYSQAADSQMTADFKEMKRWFDADAEIPKSVIQMTRDLPNLYLRDIQSKSNAKYKGVMSLIALEGAKDFNTSQMLENARNSDKDHIFPKSFKFGFGSSKYVNSVLNMTWMSDETNRKIKKFKKPAVYINEFIKEKYADSPAKFEDVLKSHLISQKAVDLLRQDDFDSFIADRDQIIRIKLGQILGVQDIEEQKTLISPDTPFSNKLAFINTLKMCDGHIYWLDKYFTVKGLELLSQSVVNNKIKEIKIIMAPIKVDEKFRDVFKDFNKEMLTRGINSELRVIVDPRIASSVHDRFIISKYDCYNIPSPDVIARGQLSEISKSSNKDDLTKSFFDIWEGGKDIILEWNTIRSQLSALQQNHA